jgi:hypothetical protein
MVTTKSGHVDNNRGSYDHRQIAFQLSSVTRSNVNIRYQKGRDHVHEQPEERTVYSKGIVKEGQTLTSDALATEGPPPFFFRRDR